MNRKEYRQKWSQEGKCSSCGRLKDDSKFKRCIICRDKRKEYRVRNLERELAWSKEGAKKAYHKLRNNIIELLGNKCSNPNCLVPDGCKDIRCLQIDHVNGKGKHEIHSLGIWKYYRHVYEELLKGSKEYQLLCANCNQIKKIEKEEF